MTPDEIDKIIERLNHGDRLEAMWEVALLKSIILEPDFEHEAPLENGRRPDFKTSLRVKERSVDLHGDITTLSDEGIDNQNPVLFFMEEFFKQKKKHDLLDMSLSTRFHHNRDKTDIRAKTTLQLPLKGEIPNVIKTLLIPRLKNWKRDGVYGEQIEIDERGLKMSLTRLPDGTYSNAGYAGYQNVGRAKDSPLFKKLKDKKSQLSGIPENAVNILVICDGGSHVIKPSLLYSPFTLNLEEICRDFLRQNSSLDMVAMIAVSTKSPQPFIQPPFDKEVQMTFISQSEGNRRRALSDDVIAAAHAAVERWVRALPKPLSSPSNSRRKLHNPLGPTIRGGWKMSGTTIHIPSRRAIELLAGICSPREWESDYKGTGVNPASRIRRMLFEGRTIQSVHVERRDDADDDWLVVTFSEPDAAFSAFNRSRN